MVNNGVLSQSTTLMLELVCISFLLQERHHPLYLPPLLVIDLSIASFKRRNCIFCGFIHLIELVVGYGEVGVREAVILLQHVEEVSSEEHLVPAVVDFIQFSGDVIAKVD